MATEIHYEIFRRQGKSGWALHDVVYERDSALRIAQLQRAEGGASAVKVIKETYNAETGDYLTLKIFEDGLESVKTQPAAEDVPHALPCFKPDDLYSYHARSTMARLLTDFLSRQKITVTELIHRGDLLEEFEATGTLYQHAVQKIAVAQASSTTTPVTQIVKTLNDLVTKAIQRVYRDERRNYFPDVKLEAFGALAQKLAADADGAYVFNAAIARQLRDAKGWDEKVFRLLTIVKQAPEDGPARQLIFASVDHIIAEILSGSAALHELVASGQNLGTMLASLVNLFLGKEPEGAASEREGLAALTKNFAADDLPAARTAIANRIVAEIKSVKRLCPDSLVDELKTLRRIANSVVLGVGKYMSHEDLIAAFTLRSKRLVTHEALTAHLADAATPDEKVDRILFVEENVIGVENKRQLSAFLLPLVTAMPFENYFLNPKLPILSRLQRLASLQTRVRRSSMQETQRDEIAAAMDKVAFEAEARAKLLEAIEARATSNVDKAVSILRLITSNTFTEGRLSARARELVTRHIGKPGFLNGYAAHLATAPGAEMPTAEAAMADLTDTLAKAGITIESGQKSAAA
jgi:hypothetical protein